MTDIRKMSLRLADKYATLTAGWMFNAATMEQFYKEAYEAGFRAGVAEIHEEKGDCNG